MKNSEIYRKAAEMLDSQDEEFSCLAIKHVVSHYGSYFDLPIARDYCEFWGFKSPERLQMAIRVNSCRNEREFRVWLLCLASAIAESEGE